MKKKKSLLVFMDMSKTFDSINHDILLSKLRSLGVSQSALEMVQQLPKGKVSVRLNWGYSF